jgi:hypothetical protein
VGQRALQDDSNPGGLGYVDAGHQKLDPPRPGPTVLTYYQALGDVPMRASNWPRSPGALGRAALAALAGPHPDVLQRATRVEVTRYGHAMSIPVPGVQTFLSQIGLQRRQVSASCY